ncbi:MAG: hypothetical protein GY950_16945, partial [bacterium]|nr:hypothetical protein [bacterium]
RFVEHCKKLGIPNPYSFKEIFDADGRWNKLQKFAVPSLDKFGEESSNVKDNLGTRLFAENRPEEEGDFDL